MLSVERQRRLLSHVRCHGSGNVVDLAAALGVSASTVRRDLRELDERGLLVRVHGGAGVIDSEPVRSSRAVERSAEKQRIGHAAAALVPDGATVLVNSGTTTEAMVPFLSGRSGVTVLTNGLKIAYDLARHPEITVVVLGGVLRHEEMSLLGRITEQALAEFRVDIAFSSAFGIDADVGLSGAHVTEAGTDRRMLQAADQLVALVDASKFGRRGPVRLADVEQISCVVTDDAAPRDALHALRTKAVQVITA